MSGLSAIDNIIYSCISAISLIFISAVIFSIILFKKTVWKRYYIRLIFYVQASDFLATLGYSIGIQHDGTFGCYFQAFMTNHFALSSVLWTLCIVYQLYIVVIYLKKIEDERILHIICWGMPFLISLLPLSTEKYGLYFSQNTNDEEHIGYSI